MALKSKTITVGLFFITFFYVSILFAFEINLPLPKNSIKISDGTNKLGPSESFYTRFESPLSEKELLSFYKKEMTRAGWTEIGSGSFIKDNNSVVILVKKKKNRKGKTAFLISSSQILKPEDILSSKKIPDKLTFMPVYPGSRQILLFESEHSLTVWYLTKRTVKDVVFFLKSGMLNYNWDLEKENSIKDRLMVSSKINLVFKRGVHETCSVKIAALSSLNETFIEVYYNARKKIKF